MADLKVKRDLYAAVWKIVICEMEHDPDHRKLGESILKEIAKSMTDGEWKFEVNYESQLSKRS